MVIIGKICVLAFNSRFLHRISSATLMHKVQSYLLQNWQSITYTLNLFTNAVGNVLAICGKITFRLVFCT